MAAISNASVQQFMTEVKTAGQTNANAVYSSPTDSKEQRAQSDHSSSSKSDTARQGETRNSNDSSRSIDDAADTKEQKYAPGTGLKSKVSDDKAFDSIQTSGGSTLLKPGQTKPQQSKL